jgi:UDP-N-acetylglucosamine transferase subunit ALG13
MVMNVYMTVGTQLPFDRLVKAMDEWAGRSGACVTAQIGKTDFRPKNMEWRNFMESDEADRLIRESDLVAAHAGMGTILNRLQVGRPLVIMPRRAHLAEHRNDHQQATAARLAHLSCITVVEDERSLAATLDSFRPQSAVTSISSSASPALLQTVRDFILTARD